MTKFEELKKQATVRVHSHGAFGEHESYDQLDVDKFYELVVLECITEIRRLEEWNSSHDLQCRIANCVLHKMELPQHCEND